MPHWSQRPEAVLKADGLAEYETGKTFIYGEMVNLSIIIYVANQIIQFPWRLFGRQEENFFTTVMRSLHDSAILIVTKLAADQGTDPFTLLRFKNRVRSFLKPEFLDEFNERIRNVRFDATINEIIAKARDARNNYVAHSSRSFVHGEVTLYRPSLTELEDVRDALQRLFDELSFDVHHNLLPLDYDPLVRHGGNQPHKTDIEQLLDSVAQNSPVFTMPEHNPVGWRFRKERMGATDLEILNRYRRKLGYPDA